MGAFPPTNTKSPDTKRRHFRHDVTHLRRYGAPGSLEILAVRSMNYLFEDAPDPFASPLCARANQTLRPVSAANICLNFHLAPLQSESDCLSLFLSHSLL